MTSHDPMHYIRLDPTPIQRRNEPSSTDLQARIDTAVHMLRRMTDCSDCSTSAALVIDVLRNGRR